ncbi:MULTISPECIES: hypothetical protein [unclassified Oceanispirochaeta]|uniref:hypothetical protein n=1 Tax=unclassified Oceanispirochaeta TaxID=2635722 RepID=UPI000E09648B|nr:MULTISPECIES: hypothetical protein [unclassified Oceanispirochaeta]MBF9016442.1 hypothetical protein [Oceanispirochaeta sp. M2]NPD72904.1 hypothetical protein [Oceanispirochaeta sp. M1]RDG31481.1 hypothetical protein DV872_12415 [Oceanispirochaeta sp. M1]
MSRQDSYSYIHKLHTLFIPRTPSAALQAARADILPIEAFIYKSTALNPILKKPYNLDEIEWLLSKRNRDLETNLILKTVLSEISRYEDKEIALFAAESLNAIEKDYNSKLMDLKDKIKEKNKAADKAKAAEIYYQMALLNSDESTLSNFYMKEAYLMLTGMENDDIENADNRILLIKVLLNLKLYDQAEQLLPEHKESRLLRLEIAYSKKSLAKVQNILEDMREDSERSEEEQKVLNFWSGSHD